MLDQFLVHRAKAMAACVYEEEFPGSGSKAKGIAKCPFHEDRTPSFSFDRESGAFKCFGCGISGGDIIEYRRKRTGESFQEAVYSLSGGSSLPIRQPRASSGKPVNIERLTEAIERVCSESIAIDKGCPAHAYLTQTRGLSITDGINDLLWHPALEYWNPETKQVDGVYPAMIGVIRNPAGKVVNLHRTFLTPDGRKAPVDAPKRIMASPKPGITNGGAIRLYQPGETLGLAEGIETAIACQNRFQIPTWACISANGLESIVLPDAIRAVVIFADNDTSGTGAKKAISLEKRLRLEGRHVKSIMPNQVQTDWASI